MGKIKYIDKIRKFFKDSPVVSIASLKKFIGEKNNKYIYLIINKMLKKNEMKKITKGYYSIYEDPSLAVFCFKPAYLGLQDALSFHNLWEQETNPVIITSRKIRRGVRKVFTHNVVFKKIDSKYLFGFNYEKCGDFYFPYSNIEKTFIDMVYFRNNLDKETLKNIKERINRKKLNLYLKVYPKRFKKLVLKFLN